MPDLRGIRVVITRPKAQYESFANKIKESGGEPICFPLIEVVPVDNFSALDKSLGDLASYEWLIFTSKNGARIFWERFSKLGLESIPNNLKVAAVGSKTAQALIEVGISPNFTPDEYISDTIISGLGGLKNKKVLLPRALISRDTLPKMIRKAGGLVDDIPIYRTIPVIPDLLAYKAVEEKVDVVTFTSSSSVESFATLINSRGNHQLKLRGNPAFAFIGPITAHTAREHNIPISLIAETYTTEGLTNALVDYFIKQGARL
ncbi:MAG: uroporphyrinogen-III synthase [Anaerolineae bacterium]|nr:uroporphyrinogen-III synthase [Anaerolineae bacterium]